MPMTDMKPSRNAAEPGDTDVQGPARVLAVDDNESKRYCVVHNLRRAGFTVDEAATGGAALRLLARKPSLVVLDVNLPDISGLEVCRRIRENPETASIPILHLSATFTDSESKARGLEAGADVYIAEPVGGAELIATVKALLRARRAEWMAKQAEARYRRLSEALQASNDRLTRELAERKRLERRFAAAERGAAIGVWDWEAGSDTLYLSRGWKSMLGYGDDEIPNTLAATEALLHPEDLAANRRAVPELLEDPERREYSSEIRLRHKDGSYRHILSRGRLVRDPDGRARRMVGVNVDITDKKHTEIELTRVTEDVKRAYGELEQFTSIVSHDLKEPLRTIASFLRLLERENRTRLDARSLEYLDYAVGGAVRLGSLVDSLLEYCRVGYKRIEEEAVDLNRAVEEALAGLGTAVRETGARIRKADLPTVRADRTQMVQVLQNLFSNALKFRRPGEAPLIAIDCVPSEAGHCTIRVTDNGIGFPEEKAEVIFSAFQRLHSESEYPGSGIGLSVCRKVIERHGGKIWADSRPGKGTSVYFTLPC